MSKTLALQALDNHSDDQSKRPTRDRLSLAGLLRRQALSRRGFVKAALASTGAAAIALGGSPLAGDGATPRAQAQGTVPPQAHPQAEAVVAAARDGDMASLERLLAAGGSPDAYDAQGWTPLLAACGRGRADIVAKLLDRQPSARVDLPHRDTGGLPIHFAGQSGNPAVAALLLDRRADQLEEVWDLNGHTLLLQAVFYGRRDMADLALKRGANTAATTLRGLGALELALQFDNRDLADLVRPYDAPATAKAAYYRRLLRRVMPLHDLLVAKIEEGLRDCEGDAAAAAATLAAVRDLIVDKGADVNALGGPLQQTPLIVAVTGNDGKPADPIRAKLRRDIARLLLEHGADPLLREKHPMAVDAIIRASVFNHLDILMMMANRLSAQALADALNDPAPVNGLTAFHDTVLRATSADPAVRDGYLDQVRWELAHGARSDIPDYTGQTQRDIAAAAKDPALRKMLLEML